MKLILALVAIAQLFVQTTAHTPPNPPILLQGGTFITYDPNNTDYPSGLVPITGASLLAVNGTIQSITIDVPDTLPPNTIVMNTTGKIITPGFVDTHRHGWQTYMRTIASNITLFQYYYKMGEMGLPRFFYEPEDVYLSQLLGLYESLDAGVTTILDHAHHTWSPDTARAGLNASIDSGARVYWSYAVHYIPELAPNGTYFLNTTIDWELETLAELTALPAAYKGLVSVGLAYDGLPDGEEEVMTVFKAAYAANVTHITSHYVGGQFQNGLQSVNLLNNYGLLDTPLPIIFSHAGDLYADEMTLLRQTN